MSHSDNSAARTLARGLRHPYDDREPVDAAHRAALGVIAELKGRGGLDSVLDDLDAELRREIVDNLAEIIRLAHN